MSELKIRVWDNLFKEFKALDNYFCKAKDGILTVCTNNDDIALDLPTGLKDKNGKEIYEGDIVKVEDDEYTPDTNKFLGYNATVKASISKGGAFTVKNWWGEQILNWDVPLRRVEVIGNIHENGELLEGKK